MAISDNRVSITSDCNINIYSIDSNKWIDLRKYKDLQPMDEINIKTKDHNKLLVLTEYNSYMSILEVFQIIDDNFILYKELFLKNEHKQAIGGFLPSNSEYICKYNTNYTDVSILPIKQLLSSEFNWTSILTNFIYLKGSREIIITASITSTHFILMTNYHIYIKNIENYTQHTWTNVPTPLDSNIIWKNMKTQNNTTYPVLLTNDNRFYILDMSIQLRPIITAIFVQ
jgi:hypothetical protein